MLNKPLKPMLLQPSPNVVTKTGWYHSIKWDGFRVFIHYDNGKSRAFTRHGNEITSSFYPELSRIKLPVRNAILDGECICFDQSTNPPKPCWEDVMARFHTKKELAVKHLSQSMPAHFPVWDVLLVDDKLIIKSSFINRREVLERIVPPSDVLSVTPLYQDGEHLFLRAKELGLEGICSYNGNPGPKSYYYLDSRPKDVWVKTKAYQYATCQVTSIRKNKFGWGLSINGKYVGVLEFPPPTSVTQEFYKIANQIVCSENKDWIFLEPLLSCKIKFQCYTKDGKLRSPKFEEFCAENIIQSINLKI
jgi:DNA ligase 1